MLFRYLDIYEKELETRQEYYNTKICGVWIRWRKVNMEERIILFKIYIRKIRPMIERKYK